MWIFVSCRETDTKAESGNGRPPILERRNNTMKMRYKYEKAWNYIDFTMDNLGMKFEEYESRNKTTPLELSIDRTDKYGIDVFVGDIIDCD